MGFGGVVVLFAALVREELFGFGLVEIVDLEDADLLFCSFQHKHLLLSHDLPLSMQIGIAQTAQILQSQPERIHLIANDHFNHIHRHQTKKLKTKQLLNPHSYIQRLDAQQAVIIRDVFCITDDVVADWPFLMVFDFFDGVLAPADEDALVAVVQV